MKQLTPQRQRSAFTGFKGCLGIGLCLACLLLPWPVEARRYKPPSGDPPNDSFSSNGSRAPGFRHCASAQTVSTQTETDQPPPLPLTLFSPLSHVGRTTTTTPTLVWFIPVTEPYRLRLSLFALDSDQNTVLLHELEYVEQASGVIQYTLPDNQSELQTGQRYIVRLSLACNSTSDRFNQSFVTELDIKAPSPTLKQALSQAKTPQAKAALYAEAGYWFDTVRELLVDATQSKSYAQVRTLLKELAESEKAEDYRQTLVQLAETLKDDDLGPSADGPKAP
ncbi:DUF928 domain-containing protein [Acaryochloris sp. IP29b_bin.148]|uniref:DUF928 domain-containing protein n=1 Tax=Acaryochloris sp. IP29b_bin.148 TaxID=2969218 RepID=UPI002606467F|nr:DUF928 domain-containing protein [Acaryochloris sp. IP29b_bin.148]